ncbi:hypothetical protein EVAR_18661_1 [Eumeta japonica]|uniref:Uncharacterized protein n=1 Tax=Eumeta variegata TaxID=151549 RepID=A0A4C1U6Y4_EUMVA|nr:hypothetical protein EVAR_18661_1 [Eumeta japonica]
MAFVYCGKRCADTCCARALLCPEIRMLTVPRHSSMERCCCSVLMQAVSWAKRGRRTVQPARATALHVCISGGNELMNALNSMPVRLSNNFNGIAVSSPGRFLLTQPLTSRGSNSGRVISPAINKRLSLKWRQLVARARVTPHTNRWLGARSPLHTPADSTSVRRADDSAKLAVKIAYPRQHGKFAAADLRPPYINIGPFDFAPEPAAAPPLPPEHYNEYGDETRRVVR